MKFLFAVLVFASTASFASEAEDKGQHMINDVVQIILSEKTKAVPRELMNQFPEKIVCNEREISKVDTPNPSLRWGDDYQVDGTSRLTKSGKIYMNLSDNGDQYDELVLMADDLVALKSAKISSFRAIEVGGFEHGGDFYSMSSIGCELPKAGRK